MIPSPNKTLFHSLIPFWVYILLFQVAASLHYTILAPIGERVLPIWLVGVLIGAAAFVQLILDIPAGHMLDRKGYLKMLRVTTLLFVIAVVFLTFKLTVLTFVLTLFIGAFGWLFYGSGAPAYMLAVSPRQLAGKYMGIKDTAKSAGTVIGVLLLPKALDLPIHATGIFLTIIMGIALATLAFARSETEIVSHENKKIPTQHYFIRRKPIAHFWHTIKRFNPVTTTLLLQNFAASTFYAIIWFVVPLALIHQSHSGWTESGLAVFDLAVVVLGGALGYLVDRSDKKILVFIGLAVFALMGTILGFSLGIWFLIIGFLATSGEELAGLSLWAWLNTLDKEHAEDGYIAGIVTFFSDFGWTIGPPLAGILYSTVGPRWAILCGGLFLVIALLVYVFIAFQYPHLHRPVLARVPLTKPRLYKHKH